MRQSRSNDDDVVEQKVLMLGMMVKSQEATVGDLE